MRWDPNVPRERSSQMLFIAESATPRNVVDPVVGLLEGPPRSVDTNAFNSAGGCPLACLSVAASEITGTHSCTLREPFYAQVRCQILGDPAFQVSEPVARRLHLGGEKRAVLRLTAHAPQIDHEDARDVHRHRSSTVLLDQREGQVGLDRYAG